VGYAKGGSGDLVAHSAIADFHTIRYAGQMVVGTTPVLFCFVLNWTSPTVDTAAVIPAFAEVVLGSLEIIKQSLM
jgi:hypothetical protein